MERQYENIELCLVNIQLPVDDGSDTVDLQSLNETPNRGELLRKKMETSKDRVTEYFLPFYATLQEELVTLREQFKET